MRADLNSDPYYRDSHEMQVARAELALALRTTGFSNRSILSAMERTPRHIFIPWDLRELSATDTPLPIECGQTMLAPSTVAMLLHAASPLDGQKILEIGTGSGYQTAILAQVADKVFSIERYRQLHNVASTRLRALKATNVELRIDDGHFGWPDKAPFDCIIINGAMSSVPGALIEQLNEYAGKLVVPLGEVGSTQRLTVIAKRSNEIDTKIYGEVRISALSSGIAKTM